MRQFIQRHRDQIQGVLSGFDWLRLRGTLRLLTSVGGMMSHLSRADGLIAVLSTLENCYSYDIHRNRSAQQVQLRRRLRKCLHYYFYSLDDTFGLTQVRLQTWFPFNVHVVLNGREWLHQQLFAECPGPYYWTSEQSEWATDIAFRSTEALGELYRTLIHHDIETFQSPDVMRFLGRKVPAHGRVNGHFVGQVVSDLKHRPEGLPPSRVASSTSLDFATEMCGKCSSARLRPMSNAVAKRPVSPESSPCCARPRLEP